ncbi:hypothetical protein F4778DRAFT_273251 [Xylariomycetidae sp. FL2044]|nr:hypothetical protein F4778DRAFT_273251 [Xylariomycetidae sp. FL2044]
MATQQEMAAYAQRLRAHTSCQNKPVTEIAIFRLKPEYESDHDAARAEFESKVVPVTTPGTPHAKGIRRISWGFSQNHPDTFVWMLSYDKIQDHWDFWQTPGWGVVMGTIGKLFVAGRPLVRHYDFGESGMLDGKEWARIFVWKEESEGMTAEQARGKILPAGDSKLAVERKQAFAEDLDEMDWYCLLLGYQDEASATREEVKADYQGEDHILQLKYS